MSPHLQRSNTANQKELTSFNGNRIASWFVPPVGRSVYERHFYPTPAALKAFPDDKNPLIPPPHWHWYQEEYFTVKQGRFIFTLEGKQTVASPSSAPVTIKTGLRHTFKPDPTSEGPCELEIMTSASPLVDAQTAEEEIGLNERFFRNLYSYLEDCGAQKVEPSVAQLVLFLHSAEVSLAFPGPGWLARPLSYAFGVVVGVVLGKYILGYKDSYPEYFDPSRMSKKQK